MKLEIWDVLRDLVAFVLFHLKKAKNTSWGVLPLAKMQTEMQPEAYNSTKSKTPP